ncbi:hypothetical protein KY314_02655 [Candidatus Woesearchaeota archaeon]|nr:hypothetical protein [Candidatus Woesearchaeota archaeon]
MKKILTILLVIAFLTGCNSMPIGNQQTQETNQQDYRTGNQGLRINFVTNAPPSRVFDTDEMNVLIEIENMGAYTTKSIADKIYLSGFDQSIITGIPTTGKTIPILEGKGPYVSRGMTDRVAFKAIPAMLKAKTIDKYPITLLATACYEYETIASGNICIDPDPYSISTQQKVCTPKDISTGGGQGGPIAVTNIEVEPSPGITRLKIDVQNVGGGEVFKPGIDALQRCGPYTSELGFNTIDYVQVYDINLPGYSIISSCRPLDQGYLRLINGQGTMYCEINTQGQSTYMTPLTIKLKYGYRNTIYKNIELLSV